MALQVVTGSLPREQLLKIAYSAWLRGDADALVALLTDDCEFQLVGNPALNPHSGLRVGVNGVSALMRTFHEDFVVREFLIEKIIAQGDNAVVHWHSSLEFVRTGRVVDSERCDIITFRGNKIHRMTCFYDSASMAIATGRAIVPAPDAPSVRARKA